MRNEPGIDRELRSLRLHKAMYDQASRLAGMGAWECELATERLTWTEGVYDLFGLAVGSPLKRSNIVGLYVDQSRHEMEFMRAETIRSGRQFVLDAEIRTARGESRWMRLSAGVTHEDGRPVRLFGAKQDITGERAAWARLKHLAERDPLTGLYNRGMFEARYRDVIGSGPHHGGVSALVLIDVDHFKAINDRLGHSAGDECLRQVAARLQSAFREAVLVARIGGDEFAVFLRAPLGAARIAQMLQRALRALAQPILWNSTCIDITVSIGARVLGQPRAPKTSGLFADADAALYAAKQAGRNAVHLFRVSAPMAVADDPAARVA